MELDAEDWMAALPEALWDTPLTHLALPGTWDFFLKPLPHTHSLIRVAVQTRKQREWRSIRQIRAQDCCLFVYVVTQTSGASGESHVAFAVGGGKQSKVRAITFIVFIHALYPGSHDAMSYCLDISSPLVESEPDSFRLLDRLCCCFTRPTIFKWATTQVK